MNKWDGFLKWLSSFLKENLEPDRKGGQILTEGGTAISRPVMTGGGAFIEGSVATGGGDFVGGDMQVSAPSGVAIGGNVSGSMVVTGDGNISRDYDIHISGSNIILAADRFIETVGSDNLPGDLRGATRKYFEFIVLRYRYLETRGYAVHDRYVTQFPLLSLYVSQMARLSENLRGSPDLRAELAGREITSEIERSRFGQPVSVVDLLRDHAGLILLGDPGSGKTTFLKFLALRLAVGEGEALGLGERLPILLPISAYANALARVGGDIRLDNFIRDYFDVIGVDLPISAMLQQALETGRALILLDGLDEIANLALRGRVMQRVVSFYAFHKQAGNKFVLTSRIVGYSEVRPAIDDLVESTLLDFNDDQIQSFLEHWTLTLEKQVVGDNLLARQNAFREQQALWAAIQRNGSVRALASNPLLLTILALIKRQGVLLPERRVELYDISLKTLLSTWNRARSLTGEMVPGRDVNPRDTIKLLAPLAYWMHTVSPGVGLVRQRDLENKLVELFNERGEPGELAARQFMEDVRDCTGVLLERGLGQYGFIHLTFEEYLAAIAIAQQGQLDWKIVADELAKRVGDAAWHEIILLCIGYIGLIEGRDQVAGNIVEFFVRESPGAPGEAVVLAGEAVLDNQPRGGPNRTREVTITGLCAAMQDANVSSSLRRHAGLVLGRLGWAPEDLDAFVEIPAGDFLYGDPPKKKALAYTYWIAKYPVTNSMFARFIQEGGYAESRFWSSEGWQWKTRESRFHPRYWDDMGRNNPIFPVVGVSLYEAEAYVNWLDKRLREAGALPEGYSARLPREEEWEKAARWTDGREYPWEGDFDTYKGNAYEGGAGGTTAVCTYPQGVSKYQVWDMSGNVWEWTCSIEGLRKIGRGGSWASYLRVARCAYRSWRSPDFFDYGYGDFGFRPVLSLADSGF